MAKSIKLPQDHRMKQQNGKEQLTQQDFLNMLKAVREGKDLDQIQDLLISTFNMYGLKMDEVAALLFSVMKNSLEQDFNKRILEEKFKIDVTKLDAKSLLEVQHALLVSYVERNKDNRET